MTSVSNVKKLSIVIITCPTFAPATIAPMVNANINHNLNPNPNPIPNPNPNPYPTLNQKTQ